MGIMVQPPYCHSLRALKGQGQPLFSIAQFAAVGYEQLMTDAIEIFDRRSVRRHRSRAARNYEDHSFLKDEITDRLVERLEEINRDFETTLDLGSHTGAMGRRLKAKHSVSADLSHNMVTGCSGMRLVADEEFLPFKDSSFDLVISNLAMHWVNDLPGAMVQINRALKPDGLFLASLFGGETLKELRQSLMQAESEVSGGVSPRISPFADVRDVGGLLQRAGFALPVADSDVVTVSYEHPLKLLRDLRGMAETNAVLSRRKSFTSKAVMMRALEIYVQTYGDSDGRVPATFQVIYMTGWRAHESQQKPMKPGSAKMRLADAFKASEQKL